MNASSEASDAYAEETLVWVDTGWTRMCGMQYSAGEETWTVSLWVLKDESLLESEQRVVITKATHADGKRVDFDWRMAKTAPIGQLAG